MDVGVNRKGWHIKGLGHHHGCGLVAHARECFKRLKRCGNLTTVMFDQHFGESFDVLGFGWGQTDLTDVGENGLHVQSGHGLCRTGFGKERRGDLVDFEVRGLGAH